MLASSILSPLRLARSYATASSLSTLVVVEHNGSQITGASLAAFTAAKKLGGSITAFVAGSNSDEIVKKVQQIEGVGKVLVSKDANLNTPVAETITPVLLELQKAHNFSHVLSGSTTFSKNVFPRLAALLDVAQISDIVDVKSADTFVRPIYAGNVIATLSSSDKVKIVTVRQTAFNKPAEGNNAPVEEVKIGVTKSANSESLGITLVKSDRPELTSAGRVVSGGRALKNKETFDSLMYPLADKLGAAVGASRAAVDAEYCSNDLQIGQTGKIVAPQLYMAVGISGAIQHLAGMKDSKVIVAINKDPEAPIFQVADYGLVADLFKAVPELTQKL